MTKQFNELDAKQKHYKSAEAEALVLDWVQSEGKSTTLSLFSRSEKVTSSDSLTNHMSYLDVCVEMHLKPEDNNDLVFQRYCDLNWITRKMIGKAELKKMTTAWPDAPEAAKYKYLWKKERSTSSKRSTEGEEFRQDTALEQCTAEERAAKLRRFLSTTASKNFADQLLGKAPEPKAKRTRKTDHNASSAEEDHAM